MLLMLSERGSSGPISLAALIASIKAHIQRVESCISGLVTVADAQVAALNQGLLAVRSQTGALALLVAQSRSLVDKTLPVTPTGRDPRTFSFDLDGGLGLGLGPSLRIKNGSSEVLQRLNRSDSWDGRCSSSSESIGVNRGADLLSNSNWFSHTINSRAYANNYVRNIRPMVPG